LHKAAASSVFWQCPSIHHCTHNNTLSLHTTRADAEAASPDGMPRVDVTIADCGVL
jgi:hypothetical protein